MTTAASRSPGMIHGFVVTNAKERKIASRSGKRCADGCHDDSEKDKPAVPAETKEQEKWLVACVARLKAGVAEIAAARSFQQFGREEENEP